MKNNRVSSVKDWAKRVLAVLLAVSMTVQQGSYVFASDADPTVVAAEQQAEAAAQQAAEEEAAKKTAEAEAAKKAAEEEAARKAAEEAAKKAAEEEAARKAAEEAAAQKVAEEAAAKAAENTSADQTEAVKPAETTASTETSDGADPESIKEDNADDAHDSEIVVDTDKTDETKPADAIEPIDEQSPSETEEVRIKKTYNDPDNPDVTVEATLQYADAVPDDAVLKVTHITPDSTDYDYNTYLDALNESARDADDEIVRDGDKYTEDNTLLYDIAFLIDEKDEDGNPTGKQIEFQPERGTVSISLKFNKSQLNELGAENKEDVEIKHLPLVDEVRDSIDTTADAGALDVMDIVVKDVTHEKVNLNAEEASFKTDNFSVFAFTVDFHLNGIDYSIPGYTQILLSTLIEKLHITVGGTKDGTLVDVKDVVEVHFTNEDLVEVEQVSGIIFYTDENGLQEDVNVGEKDFLISSKAPFTSDEYMTLVLSDGTEIKAHVTDAQTKVIMTLKFFDYNEETSWKYDDSASNLYAYVELKNKTTDEVAWTYVVLDNLRDKTEVTKEVSQFIKVDNSVPESKTNNQYWDLAINYNSDDWELNGKPYIYSTVPTYHLIHEELNEGEIEPDPSIPGAKIFSNETENGTTTIKAKKWDSTRLFVRVNGVQTDIAPSDGYWVYLTVEHQTGEDTVKAFKLDTSSAINGTIEVEIPIKGWYYTSGQELAQEKFNGGEKNISVSVYKELKSTSISEVIKKSVNDVVEVKVGSLVKDYKLVSRSSKVPLESIRISETDGTADYYAQVTFRKVEQPTSDYNFKSILGNGLYYGITANSLTQANDLQTNFAVNTYYREGHGITPNLSGDSTGTFVIGTVNSSIDLNAPYEKPVVIFTSSSSEKFDNYSESKHALVYDTADNLKNNIVDPIISHAAAVSSDMATHDANISPTITTNTIEIDATAFDDGVTIYVDGDSILNSMNDHEVRITKKDNQVIVFNFTESTNINLKPYKVNGTSSATQTSQGGEGGANSTSDMIARTVVWNIASSNAIVDLGTMLGIVLVPDGNVTIAKNSGSSGAGWIICGGDVKNCNGEWHGIYSDMPDIDKLNLIAAKKVDNKNAKADQKFTFEVAHYDVIGNNANDWTVLSEKTTNDGAAIEFAELTGFHSGWNVYRIKETGQDESTSGSYSLDNHIYFALVYVSVMYAGTEHEITAVGTPRYYSEFDESTFNYQASSTEVTGVSSELVDTISNSNGTTQTIVKIPTFYNTTDRGGLKIQKNVENASAQSSDDTFEFTITLSGNGFTSLDENERQFDISGDTTAHKIQFAENGTAKITLKGGESVVITGIPEDVTYSVTETPPTKTDLWKNTASLGTNGSISDRMAIATFVNTYTNRESSLNIIKTLVNYGHVPISTPEELTFHVGVYDAEDADIPIKFAEVTIAAGASQGNVVIDGLEVDKTYYVYEIVPDGTGWKKLSRWENVPGTSSVFYCVGNDTDDFDDHNAITIQSNAAANKRYLKNKVLADTVEVEKLWKYVDESEQPDSVIFRFYTTNLAGAYSTEIFKTIDEINYYVAKTLDGDEAVLRISPNDNKEWNGRLDLQRFDTDGNLILYFISEDVPTGYTSTLSDLTAVITDQYCENGEDGLSATDFTLNSSLNFKITGSNAITNTRNLNGKTSLGGTKTLSGREFQEGDDWTFTVTAADGTPMPEETSVTIEADKAATFSFGEIAYTQADIGKTYTYTISESGEVTNVTNDAAKTVTVKVEYDAETKGLKITNSANETPVVFVNTYEAAGDGQILALKSYDKPLKGGDFTFTLTEVADAEGTALTLAEGEAAYTETVTNDASGTITFSKIHYALADVGDHFYKIEEANGGRTIDGVIYDGTAFLVKMTVSDNGDGTLSATPDKEMTELCFTNGTVHFIVNKTDLTGDEELEGAKITVYKKSDLNEDGSVKEGATAVDTWTSKKNETKDFGDKLQGGEDYVMIEEVAPDGYTYVSNTEFHVGEDGTIKVNATDDQNDITKDASGNVNGVLVKDALSTVRISKTDLTGDRELAGAHIVILDEKGNVVEEWDSTTTAHVVTGLLLGRTYTLRETVAPAGYKITADTTFTLDKDGKPSGTVTTSSDGTILVKDALAQGNGSIKVTKYTLKGDGAYKVVSQTFHTALFSDSALSERVSEVKDLVLVDTYTTFVTFENLDYGTYYVAETDELGNPITAAPNISKVEISDGTATLTAASPNAEAAIKNTMPEGVLGEYVSVNLKVKKNVVDANGKAMKVNDTFRFRLFYDEACTEPVTRVDVQTIQLNGESGGTATFKDLPYADHFYVAEVDKNGNPVGKSFGYKVSYSTNGLDYAGVNGAQVTVTNKAKGGRVAAENRNNNQQAVRTGDETPVLPMLVTMLLAGLSALFLGIRRRRKIFSA